MNASSTPNLSLVLEEKKVLFEEKVKWSEEIRAPLYDSPFAKTQSSAVRIHKRIPSS